ncbi:hypothetical protein ANO14919_135900 [Xylariales sp. No.14919]|nr:hypothetical protein ANO14919_135900 [Xylariales sp. No.14919]
MAEAFGVAASVAGIVSLGLELSTRIITYIDAVRHWDEEISAIHRQTKTLQSSLEVLKNALPDLALKHRVAGDAVLAALKSGHLELGALKDFIERLTGSTGQSQNLKSHLKHASKRMAFPFHRGNLETLQQRLDRTNVSLDAASRTLGLVIVSSIEQSSADALSQISSLSTISAANIATSSSIKASLDTFIPQVDQALLEIKDSLGTELPDIQQSLASMSATISRQEGNFTRRIQEAQVELLEGLGKNSQQRNPLGSAVTSLNTNPVAGGTPGSDLLDGVNRLSDILSDLAEKKESDPPRILGATAEQRVLYRLVSSPAQLEKLYTLHHGNDDVEYEFTMEQRNEPKLGLKRGPSYLMDLNHATMGYMPNCICRQHHESLHRRAKLGHLSVNILTRISQKHLPECRYSKSEVISKSNSLRLSYHGLRWLLSKAVDISISRTTGLEGLKISPSITIRPTVDRTKAPTFRSLGLISRFRQSYYPYPKDDVPVVLRLIDAVVHRIAQQYMSRRSSPYEVDNKGRSVLHDWIDVLFRLDYLWDECGKYLIAMTKLLLGAGLPASLCDDQGASPGTRLLKKDLTSVFSLKRLMCILCEEAPEPSMFEEYDPNGFVCRDYTDALLELRNTIEAIEIVGCGPLSSAILLGDEAKVKSIISRYPSTVHERNLIHQTPFHLAADKPRILRLLINAASPQELDGPDSNGEYALDYALRLTPTLCSNGSSWIACSSCPCIECVEIFLNSGWRCRFGFLQYCHLVSHTARLKIIDHLVSERAVLKALGRQFLPLAEVDRCRLNEASVLDHHAHKVAELLFRDGISIPASVRATLLPQLGCGGFIQPYWSSTCRGYHEDNCLTVYTSVYYGISNQLTTESNVQLLELLYCKGFRDIDQVDSRGYSPLSYYLYRPYLCQQPSNIRWFMKHGANILQPLPVPDSRNPHGYSYGTCTVAQLVLSCLSPNDLKSWRGNHGSSELRHREEESYRELVSLVAPLDEHDECHCQCSEVGCHTTKVFFEMLWENTTGRTRHDDEQEPSMKSSSVPGIAGKISDSLQNFALDLSRWERVTRLALRYFTFEVLELRHTCCRMPHPSNELSEEEIVEIEDEDWEKLDLLELLIQDFQIAYRVFENQDGHGDKFTNFLTKEWAPRIQKELASVEAIQLTADEMRKAEEIGIQWQPILEDEDEEETRDLNYWLKKLDEIMPA